LATCLADVETLPRFEILVEKVRIGGRFRVIEMELFAHISAHDRR